MDYIFYGPYWVFCVVRAIMTYTYGDAQYGAFINVDGLLIGFFGTLIWLSAFVGIAMLLDAFMPTNTEENK